MRFARLVITGVVFSVHASQSIAGGDLAQKLLQCRQFQEDQDRLACYDSLTSLPEVSPVASVPKQRQTAPVPVKPIAKEAPAALTKPESSQKVAKFGAESMPQKRVEEALQALTATVAKVRQNVYKKLTVTLDNGQTWKQIDSKRLSLSTGDQVMIEKGVFSSYFLSKTGSDVRMKVKRTK